MLGKHQVTQDKRSVQIFACPRVATNGSGMNHVALLSVARQRRADYVRTLIAMPLDRLPYARIILIAIGLALASAVLVTAYATALSRQNMPESALAVSPAPLAETKAGTSSFASL
jgi:hypothetical protein